MLFVSQTAAFQCLSTHPVHSCSLTKTRLLQECQTRSWARYHKYECKVFAKLYPNVLPNTVRLVMQLLLQREAKSLPDPEWQAFLDLPSHIDGFRASQMKKEDGLTTWHTIELMSQAASSYSGSTEPVSFIQTLTARILINTHTLTSPCLDPLGLCLSLKSALLNHSCTPCCALLFSGSTLTLRSLAAIPAKCELSISYMYVFSAIVFPLLDQILTLEICLGSILSLDMLQGSIDLLECAILNLLL